MTRASEGPPGSETVARQQGIVGNSGDPMRSSRKGGRVAQPVNREETRRRIGSRMSPYERRGGVTSTEQRGAHSDAGSAETPTTLRGGNKADTGVESIAKRKSRMGKGRMKRLVRENRRQASVRGERQPGYG